MRDERSSSSSSLIPLPSSLGRVAVVHDWLTGMRGGEQVLEGILQCLPDAEVFTLFHFRGSVSEWIESHTIHTSSLQGLASKIDDYRKLLPLFPHAARSWDLSRFDTIVSSSHCVAKGVNARGKPHLCYCHTPMRYIWDRFDDYFPRSKPVQRAAMSVVAPWLRRWDVRTVREVTQFVANSQFVRDRIRRHYKRDSEVIAPFVDESFLQPPLEKSRNDEHVIVSALVPYKRVELAIDAFAGTPRKLAVIGSGPLLDRLRRTAPPNVSLLGYVSREKLIERLARARSLILPGVEDFGITPLEAMALGTPVVALEEGGVLDSVVQGATGIFFESATVDALRKALDDVEGREWDRDALRQHAAAFSRARFQRQFIDALTRVTSA